MAAGKAVITCKAKDGSGVFATCSVTVVNPVQSIKLNQTQRTILKGKKYTLKAKVGPKNATSKAVTWKSSDKKIATVSSKGVVTAKKAGSCNDYMYCEGWKQCLRNLFCNRCKSG